MDKLKAEVRNLISEYFDKKIANFNFYDDRGCQDEVESIIDDTLDGVIHLLDNGAYAIDRELENFDSEHAKEEQRINYEIDQRYSDEVDYALGLL